MAKKDVHIVRRPGGWAAKTEGASRTGPVLPTQREAIDAGRKTAQRRGSELVIHGRDGKIREKDSHGKDKNPPKG
jgi:hypothetical protein